MVGPRSRPDVLEKKNKSSANAGIRTPDRPGRILVTTLTELPQLIYINT
jgi:hypothetical protein